jgi:hypothetical protein
MNPIILNHQNFEKYSFLFKSLNPFVEKQIKTVTPWVVYGNLIIFQVIP